MQWVLWLDKIGDSPRMYGEIFFGSLIVNYIYVSITSRIWRKGLDAPSQSSSPISAKRISDKILAR